MPHWVKNDLTGHRFGRLLVLSFIPDDSRYSNWLCKCDCGKKKAILGQSIVHGRTRSCGCLHTDMMKTRIIHGQAGSKLRKRTRTYGSWASMMDRCIWGCHPVMFARYGAKGIKVAKRWMKFENFLADMGQRPNGTSLDRINNNGNYEPKNCRWATRREQSLNTSRTIFVLVDGIRQKVFEICEKEQLSIKAVRARARRRKGNYAAALRSFGLDAVQI